MNPLAGYHGLSIHVLHRGSPSGGADDRDGGALASPPPLDAAPVSDCGDGLAPRSFAMTLSLDAHLSAAITSSSDGENHISAIPDTLLCNVISHLPVKDAAHTGALSHR
ncbi:hypothetical protein D1007_61996 [Hordeum vulgare]|nr:hypothetical protein D1007_61996 [Hordeum vulgare]